MRIALLVSATMVCASGLYGQPAEDTDGGWTFRFTPYAWLPAVSGELSSGGRTADIDVSIADTLEDLRFGVLGRCEAWKGEWGLTLDGLYSYTKSEESIGPVDLTARSYLTLIEAGGGWRLGALPLGATEGSAAISFELLAGGRYGHTRNEIDFPGPFDSKQSDDWVAPYIGGRVGVSADGTWSFILRGDVGGFGLGQAPHFTWNLVATVDCRLSELLSLDLAYRILSINGDALDARLYGPALGMTFHF